MSLPGCGMFAFGIKPLSSAMFFPLLSLLREARRGLASKRAWEGEGGYMSSSHPISTPASPPEQEMRW